MPNILDENGLQTYTRQELLAIFDSRMREIYGNDINLESDSPDGQLVNIFIQIILDNLDLLAQIYNSFDPDLAVGRVLDQRVTLNGIQRQGGQYSFTLVEIITTQALNLYGLDQEVNPIYTVSDAEGNEWQLLETQNIENDGTYQFMFRASNEGQVLTTPNTINRPVTVVLGVQSINNPSVQYSIGTDEETDNQVKIRRRLSVALASQGFQSSLVAMLRNISTIQDAFVHENKTSTVDSDGTDPHTIWVIVSGNYSPEEVAQAIYRKRNAGAGMRGDNSYTIHQLDGSLFVVSWDDVEIIPVFIEVELESIDGSALNYDSIKNGIPLNYIPTVNETLNTSRLIGYIQQIEQNALINSAGFSISSAGAFTSKLESPSKKNQFAITSNNIILLPMFFENHPNEIAQEEDFQFSVKGGYSTYTFTIETNSSGGSIDSETGLYTSGDSAGIDTIRATDSEGNYTETTIEVL